MDANETTLAPTDTMASLFISHGAPTLPIEDSPARAFFSEFGNSIPRPKAIVIASAHWDTNGVSVLSGSGTLSTIHDFYGFPSELYEMQYPAPALGVLGDKVIGSLEDAGFKVELEQERGLDHGAWVPLKLMFPNADIPVAQISVNTARSPEYHWRLGRALAALKNDDYLVIGSGTMTHNLGDVGDFHGEKNNFDEVTYVEEFSRWMEARLAANETNALLEYRERAPNAKRAHPTAEHILPFYIALGAAGVSWQANLIHRSCIYGVINLDAYAFHVARDPQSH
ncbi:MAG: class III extradiol ring-cleavage dioxygenase [Pseudomonadota bacterium]